MATLPSLKKISDLPTYASTSSPSAGTLLYTESGVDYKLPVTKLLTTDSLNPTLNINSPLNYTRNKITTPISKALQVLDVTDVSIWEYASLITTKGDVNDYQTWDWTPAIQAAINYVISYQSQTAVNSGMFGAKRLYIPAGVYPIYSQLTVTKYGSSAGTLATSLTIVGDGMTSSIIQPMTDGQIGLLATNCKINVDGVGMRAGAGNQQHWVLGLIDTWVPVFHCHFKCVGSSGAAKGLVLNLCFDSTFEDVFVQNIAPLNSGASVSYGITIETYTGPANGGTTGDGSGDDSNQLVFIRPTVETANSDNTIMFNIAGKSNTYPHHAINVYGGHIETHNLKAKCYNLKNAFNVTFNGTVFSQNGSAVDTFYRLGYIDSSWNVQFVSCRQVTTNRLAAYDAVNDTVAIKIIGTSKNIRFLNTHFIGPYNDLSAYNRGISWLIDTTEADKATRAYILIGCTVGVYTNKDITSELRVTATDVSSREHIFRVDASGNLVLAYSSDSTDTAVPTDIFDISKGGVLHTKDNVLIGYKNTASATRTLGFYTNGDGATVMGSMAVDNAGRMYLTAMSGSNQWVLNSTGLQPTTTATLNLGASTATLAASYVVKRMYTATVGDFYGSGSPEGAVSAGIGSTYRRTDGTVSTSFYVKESGTGTTGWVSTGSVRPYVSGMFVSPGNLVLSGNYIFKYLGTAADITVAPVPGTLWSMLTPGASVKIKATTTQTTTTGTNTALTWASATTEYNSSSIYTIATAGITVPVAGIYRIAGRVTFASNNTGTRSAGVFINGSYYAGSQARFVAKSGGYATTADYNDTLSLAAGSIITLSGFQDSGGNLDTVATAPDVSFLIVSLVSYV
jgi:hypothetical protein